MLIGESMKAFKFALTVMAIFAKVPNFLKPWKWRFEVWISLGVVGLVLFLSGLSTIIRDKSDEINAPAVYEIKCINVVDGAVLVPTPRHEWIIINGTKEEVCFAREVRSEDD